jgi:hypothetical protein
MKRRQPLRMIEREAQHLHAVERAGESAETPLIAILGLAITVAIFRSCAPLVRTSTSSGPQPSSR